MSSDETKSDRRRFLRDAGVGAAMLGAVGAGAATVAPGRAMADASSDATDLAVLNFALNLEYLEAEFYLRATTGHGLTRFEVSGLIGPEGYVTGGRKVAFQNTHIASLANDIASDEHAHVKFLRAALGRASVARPTINLTDAFNTLGNAAGIGDFDPFSSDENFLLGAYVFEDVGVTAYHGGARLITNKDYLGKAAGILGTEAYHAGAIRLAILRSTNATIVKADKISNLRSILSAGRAGVDDFGPQQKPGVYNLVSSDSDSITFERTPRQVLNIVYGGVNSKGGLFFPNGLNGAVK